MHPKSSDEPLEADEMGSWVGERQAPRSDTEPRPRADSAPSLEVRPVLHADRTRASAPSDPEKATEDVDQVYDPAIDADLAPEDYEEDPPLENAEAARDSSDTLPIPLSRPSPQPPPTEIDDFTPSVAGAYEIELGRVIDGRYRIEQLLGTGAVGLVYRCRHLVLGKDVAIKVLRPDFAMDREVSERLVTEAKAASAIGSSHIVETIDFGRLLDGSAFFVMEYLEGESLADRIDRDEPLSASEVLHIAIQITLALSEAHAAGIVHRDLKPDNVFLVARGSDRSFVKILDFGIAKLARAESKLTRSGRVYGTPHYMSPEQAGGRPTDERTDVYAVGVLLFEMLTGRVPFDAEEPMGILTQHLYDEPPPLDSVRSSGSPEIRGADRVVGKCLAKSRDDRYVSMDDLRADLERLQSGAEPDAVPTPAPPRALGAAPLPAAPSLWTRGAYVVAVVGLLASAGLGYALYAKRTGAMQPRAASAPTQPVHPKPAAPPPASAALSEPTPPGTDVILVVIPADAKIHHGKQDLGPMPVTIPVPDGERVQLAIRRSGFVSRRLTLDGSRERVVVGLVPRKAKRKDQQDGRDLWAEAEAAADRAAAESVKDGPLQTEANTETEDESEEAQGRGSPASEEASDLESPYRVGPDDER